MEKIENMMKVQKQKNKYVYILKIVWPTNRGRGCEWRGRAGDGEAKLAKWITAGNGNNITAHQKPEGDMNADVYRVIAPRAMLYPSAAVIC